MTRVAITGADGFLGWHLRCHLHAAGGYEVVSGGRRVFASDDALRDFVRSADAIVHLAGVNRGPESEIEETNEALAVRLVHGCEETGSAPHLVFANSTQWQNETAYGRSKRRAALAFRAFADRTGSRFSNVILPNIFGEHGRPFYNSVVSTFSHQLATGGEPKIENDTELQLLHAQDAAGIIADSITQQHDGDRRCPGAPVTVSRLLEVVRDLADTYLAQQIPDLRDRFRLNLFNTFRSYLFPSFYPVDLKVDADNRGYLFEAVRTENGGQSFLSNTVPSVTRGNHYHLRKVERFLVLEGEACIDIRRLFSDEVLTFKVSGGRKQFIDIPTMHTHNLTNIGAGDLTTLFWANEIFDPTSPDTVAEPV